MVRSEHVRPCLCLLVSVMLSCWQVMKYNENTVVRLQLWDIAGQERFGNMTRVYYRDAAAAFIVFDLTRRGTFEAVRKWKEDLDTKVITSDGQKVRLTSHP